MKKNLDFTYVTSGLEVSFRVLTKVPAKSIFDWDFGDDKGEVFNGGRHQSYSYEKSGFYDVTLPGNPSFRI
jgi:PKD repeat protein